MIVERVMSNSATIVYTEYSVFESSKGWRSESGRQASALSSLSVFGGNFVLAKVRWGLISVRCSEFRGVRFSEVRNVLVLW